MPYSPAPSRVPALLFTGLLGLLLPFAAGAQQANTDIGVAAAVGPVVESKAPNAEVRQLFIGNRLVHNERLETSPEGRTQVLFLDGSALTVGPRAQIVLDEFVYDPESKTGKLALSATRGLFRYVGGKISKKTPVRFKTPTATIGIRGGITIINVVPNTGPQVDGAGIAQQAAQQQAAGGTPAAGASGGPPAGGAPTGGPSGGPPPGGTTATFVFGDQMTVSSGGQTTTVSRPGFQVTTTSAGAPPSAASRAAPASLSASLDSLEANRGGGDQQNQEGSGQDVAQNQGGNQQGGNQQGGDGQQGDGQGGDGQQGDGQGGDGQQQGDGQGGDNQQAGNADGQNQQAQNQQNQNQQNQNQQNQNQQTAGQQSGQSLAGQAANPAGGGVPGAGPGQGPGPGGGQRGPGGRQPLLNQQMVNDRFSGGPPTAGITPVFNPSLPSGPQGPQLFGPGNDPNTQAPEQQAALENVSSQPQFPGRYKTSPNAGPSRGTGDASPQFNRRFNNGVIDTQGRLRANLGGQFLDLPAPVPGQTVTFQTGGTQTPFGPVSGSVVASAKGDFNVYRLNEIQRSGSRALLFFGVRTPIANIPTIGVDEFDLRPDFVSGSNIPLIPADLGGSIGFTGSNGTVGDGGVLWQLGGGNQDQRPVAFGNVHVRGAGLTQESAFGGFIGHLNLVGPNAVAIAGHMRGSSNLNNGQNYFFHGAVGSSEDGNGTHLFGKDRPDAFVLQGSTLNADGSTTPTPVIADGIDGSTTSYFPNAVADRDATPETGASETRTGGTITGFVTGALIAANASGTVTDVRRIDSQGPLDGISLIKVAANNKIAATIKYDSAGTGTDDTTVQLGGNADGRSFFAFDDALGAVEAGNTTATVEGATVSRLRAYLVASPSLDSTSLGFIPSGVSFCNCQALQWGFWGSDIVQNGGVRDRTHLATWVAGTAANAVDIASLGGSATYNGHAIGTVIRGSGASARTYLAVGNYSQTYNFASDTGTLAITSFDGTNYSGTISGVSAAQAHRFTGSLSGDTITSRTGSLGGAFFTGSGDNARYAGGQFGIEDNTNGYFAAGIFAAEKN